jgi:fibronectin-binding autotransporter adhesin
MSYPTHAPRASGAAPLAEFLRLMVLALCALGWVATPARATYRTWTGAINGYWSNPGNWNPGQPPQAGETLSFGNDASRKTMTNDMSNVSVAILAFSNDNSVYELDGNAVTLTGSPLCQVCDLGVVFVHPADSSIVVINCPLNITATADIQADCGYGVLSDDVTLLYLNGPISIGANRLTFDAVRRDLTGYTGGHGEIYVAGQISGTGDVLAETDGDSALVEFYGTQDSALAGLLYVTTTGDSHIIFNQASGHAVTNALVVSEGYTAKVQFNQPDQIAHSARIVVGDQALLQLSGTSGTSCNVAIEALPGETRAPTLDTGSVVLGVESGGITAFCSDNTFSPVIKGKIKLNTQLPISTMGNGAGLDIQATVQGAAGFQKLGDGILILSAPNTFSGHLDVHEGTLDVRDAGALGDIAGVTFLTGTGSLTLRNVTINGEILTADGYGTVVPGVNGSLLFTVGNCAWNGPILLDTNLVVYADFTALNGAISGAGGIDFINGTAIIGGTANNTYTGTTLARCDSLQLDKPAGTKAFSGPLVVGGGLGGPYQVIWLNAYQNPGATLTLHSNAVVNLNNHNEDFGAVTFNGGEVDTGTGQFAIYQPLTVNASSVTATINGLLGLPAGDSRYFVVNDGPAEPDLLVNAVMFGSPSYFVKQGPGTMRLAGANTFAAVTLHEGGTLDVANPAALSTAGCVIFDGATLRLNASGLMPNNFEAVGAGTGGINGAFQVADSQSVTLNGSIYLDANTVFNVDSLASLTLSGVINGNGPFTKNGSGSLMFSGSAANTYAGLTTINSGLSYLAKSGGAVSVPGNLVLGPAPLGAAAVAMFLSPNSIGGNIVTVNANASLNLNGRVQTLSQVNLNDGGSVATAAGILYLNGGSTVSVGSQNGGTFGGSHVSSSITGNLGLPPNDFAINFSVSPYSIRAPIDSRPELDVPASIFITSAEIPTLTPTKITKSGAGRMRLAGANSYRSATVTAGVLQVDGSQPASGVLVSSGTLQGTGSVGPVVLASASSTVAPGDNPGILTCGNFDNGGGTGVLKLELNGTAPGSGYSQLNVNGTVNLTGVRLSASLGYASSVGDQFTVIANDGFDAITGTFTGLPQGGKLYIGQDLFQINYAGGSGNDVVLTRQVTPPPPVLRIEQAGANDLRLLWPTNDPPFSLLTATNLPSPNWIAALPSPVVIGTNNVLTNTIDATNRYYRLSPP